jgi:hypothetical protein
MSDFDEQLKANETELTGHWHVQNGRVTRDTTSERIEWLIEHCLLKIADSPGGAGWVTLYQDPRDGRFWERTYPQGEMHGGGPPQHLRTLTSDEVQKNMELDSRCDTGRLPRGERSQTIQVKALPRSRRLAKHCI